MNFNGLPLQLPDQNKIILQYQPADPNRSPKVRTFLSIYAIHLTAILFINEYLPIITKDFVFVAPMLLIKNHYNLTYKFDERFERTNCIYLIDVFEKKNENILRHVTNM